LGGGREVRDFGMRASGSSNFGLAGKVGQLGQGGEETGGEVTGIRGEI
jgi:hypothetical protein